MFKFGKKNEVVTEQYLEEVSDEQLSQVAGGSLHAPVNLDSVVATVKNVANPVTQVVTTVSGNELEISPKTEINGANVTSVVGNLLP
ncbi:hypothetical protein [Dictyobacter aurantiacus]|uniref:Uncharacterized protein n=1 Tax=Dictyobacter aurantiacus TaxID=1936993 RepID=A0A401ZGT8_9CHLR|nr:hypothetical protein [Dictyobacter aurantiacus]GCE06077.1 hypothetical protein KDAU_34060 [Dictyobacter aurantiacus]